MTQHELQSNTRRRTVAHASRRTAFTVVELVVTVSLVAMLLTLTTPAVHDANRNAQQLQLENKLLNLTRLLEGYRATHPSNRIPTLAAFVEWYRNLEPTEFDNNYQWEEGSEVIEIRKYDYCVEVRSIDYDGFVLCLVPKPPYRTGYFLLCIDQDGHTVEERSDEEGERIYRERMRRARWRVYQGLGDLIANSNGPVEASAVLPYLELTENNYQNAKQLDSDDDEFVGFVEFEAFMAPKEDDPKSLAIVRDTYRDVFAICRFDDDNIMPGISVVDFASDAADVFSAESLAIPIDQSVAKEGVAFSLYVKLRSAEEARFDGDLHSCEESVQSFRNELAAQSDKSISSADALMFDYLASVLCPEALPQEVDVP
ncbi:type II secretion system GspH family protein [Aeoliella sp. ICT_H6.2]|uniref:Type II secretion system GspH family protein n=1 Tax=Aeoliella straminimaris TaxID=2954799 RepID=A0A9X2F9E8_9BACT|nr:type II secretion system protein [Aeoliella straminimaris]MCO6044073.1 type II secretion system GspH family protein [Aeoliella straminimaris]